MHVNVMQRHLTLFFGNCKLQLFSARWRTSSLLIAECSIHPRSTPQIMREVQNAYNLQLCKNCNQLSLAKPPLSKWFLNLCIALTNTLFYHQLLRKRSQARALKVNENVTSETLLCQRHLPHPSSFSRHFSSTVGEFFVKSRHLIRLLADGLNRN